MVLTYNIDNYLFNDDYTKLYIEFTTEEDSGDEFRSLELDYWDIEYYSPCVLNKRWLQNFETEHVHELIEQYVLENGLPQPQTL